MTLHLTFCRRADVNPTEAMDLANKIDRGDVVLSDWHNNDGIDIGVRGDSEYLAECGSAREIQTVVDALRAFA